MLIWCDILFSLMRVGVKATFGQWPNKGYVNAGWFPIVDLVCHEVHGQKKLSTNNWSWWKDLKVKKRRKQSQILIMHGTAEPTTTMLYIVLHCVALQFRSCQINSIHHLGWRLSDQPIGTSLLPHINYHVSSPLPPTPSSNATSEKLS